MRVAEKGTVESVSAETGEGAGCVRDAFSTMVGPAAPGGCESDPAARVVVEVPGFPASVTRWCAGHLDELDLGAVLAMLPDGSVVEVTAARAFAAAPRCRC